MRICHLDRVLVSFVLLLAVGAVPLGAIDKKDYKVFIVSDTLGPWALDTQTGFKQSLDKALATQGAKASYTVFDTKVDPATIPDIVKALKEGQPDLVLVCNYPNGFADSQVTSQFKGSTLKFVSLNPIPVEIGLIKSWQKPGDNVTGVGVFIQFTSALKLAQMINPKIKKVAFVSWNAMGAVNDWFQSEMKDAARESGVELAEFRLVASNEEELAFYRQYVARASDTFVMTGITAFVHDDGHPFDGSKDWYPFIQKEMGKLLYIGFDDSTVANGVPAAAAVIWTDIGAQAAEKAKKILDGAKPGDLPWEYPRKHNLIFNLQAAKDRGVTIPSPLISSAYRVYTDYQGNFVGQKK